MRRTGLLILAALLLCPMLGSAYTMVLKNGRKIEAQSRYAIEQGVVKFTGTDGRAYQFALAEVDLVATNRANQRRAPKVWTNDDLGTIRGGTINVLGAAGAPAAAAASSAPESAEAPPAEGAAPADAEGKPAPLEPREDTPEYWQKRLAPLRAEIAQIEQQLQQLRSSQGKADSNALSLNTDALGVDVQDTIRRLEQRRTQLQRQIEDIQLEAKRRGIPPGAVR